MIVGFSRHGTGGGSGPVDYVTDAKRKGRENAPPEVVRGDAEHTRNLIDSLDFEHKYTSGVLSFAPNEVITTEMEEAIMNRFESVAFAGLEPDQYNILWVRHTHAGHHELHFVTPRVELSTGKSLNIKPPGQLAQDTFDDFRSEINARYGLADPDDPDRARNVSTPDHELKMAAEAIRSGQKPKENIRVLIDEVLTERAVQGLINSRNDVLENVQELGFTVGREGKDYITVTDPESGGRWRLKGALYARDYEPSQTIERAEKARERDYGKPDAATASRYEARVNEHIAKRAEYHQGRYKRPNQEHRLEHVQEPFTLALGNRGIPLSRYLERELGSVGLLHKQGHNLEPEHRSDGERGGQGAMELLRGEAQVMRENRPKSHTIRQERGMANSGGVLDDRVRKTLAERFRGLREAVQRTTSRVRDNAKQLAENVRAYLVRESETTKPSDQLNRASQQLDLTSERLGKVVQHEQALERQHQRASRDYGMSL